MIYEQITVKRMDLTFHPHNYKQHPDEQLAHIMKSLQDHGFYRNIVVARDNVVLAGHGVVQAAARLHIEEIPVIRLPIESNSPQAYKVMVGDNEISRLADIDDRMLITIMEEQLTPEELAGTGFDAASLAAFKQLCATPDDLVPDKDEEAAWESAGAPGYEHGAAGCKLVVNFPTVADREAFTKMTELKITKKHESGLWSAWWPEQRKEISEMEWIGGSDKEVAS